MSNVQKNKEVFELISKDAQSWLAQAKQLKMSADVILPKLKEAFKIPPARPGAQEKRLAFFRSYMLLVGFAFENLIKGILIGRDPTLVDKEEIKGNILRRGGHGIVDKSREILSVSSTSNEYKLLQRVEEYLFWAGRYPLPKKLRIYNEAEEEKLRSGCSDDPELIDALFERLKYILEQEWKARDTSASI